jgi:nicotinate-nucleotide--dimethylbenzimidazole phosphoribosyltransferase
MNPLFRPYSAQPKLTDAIAADKARRHQDSLTKPPGALGELESIAIRLAALQSHARPRLDRVQISVYAADHGIAAENISAFPQAVTVEMIRNFARGGAAISVLARCLGATLEVVNLGTIVDCGELAGVKRVLLGPGTANFARQAAMTDEQCTAAMNVGGDSVRSAEARSMNLFIGGEMGIGNTTAAAALACALLGTDPALMVGPGTGLDAVGVRHKAEVVERVLALHAPYLSDPAAVLCRLGGFEIAALTGAFLACAQNGIPALIDGFIASVAALIAERICPGASRWWLFAHRSSEPGHAHVLGALKAKPLLDLGMRLGEASGAAVAVPILRLACELHNGMASFDEAGVSTKIA